MDTQTIAVADVVVENRIRKELGDIAGLAQSIKENGLIEPIVLAVGINTSVVDTPPIVRLIAGERRFRAMQSLGIVTLEHGIHFVWRTELRDSADPKIQLLAASIELEENIRRKDLTWQEQVLGKQRLLDIMQKIHGVPSGGAPNVSQKLGLTPKGFSVLNLSAMLGESLSQTSEDLKLASLVTKIPILANEPSKEAAMRKLNLAIAQIVQSAAPEASKVTPLEYRIIIICDDEKHQAVLLRELQERGLKCQPMIS